MLHVLRTRTDRHAGGAADDHQRGRRPRGDARRADRAPARPGGGRRPAARHRLDPVAVPERGVRGAHGRGVPRGRRRRVHPRRLRRPVSRGRPALSRGAPGRDGLDAAFPAVEPAHAGAGARDDRRRPRSAADVRRSARHAGAPSPDALRRDAPGRPAATADPCGERGEFHTCVTAGPCFRARFRRCPGVVVERDGFVFADLLPAPPNGTRRASY